ncbi:MAG: PDZ domain-containing protein [Gammaproteobacteria bacterium]
MSNPVSQAPIVYHVRPLSPCEHLYEVTCRIEHPDPDGQVLRLPAWIPGSYLIRDYARHIVQIQAASDGEPAALRKLDKHSWRIAPVTGALLVTITVYAGDNSVRGAWLDKDSGFFNGVCLFLQVCGQEQARYVVHIDPPELPPGIVWQLATSLPRLTGAAGEFGAFHAVGYTDLIDHPVLMGRLAVIEFEVAGTPHALAMVGNPAVDQARLRTDLMRLCTWHIDFFGRPAPMSSYQFLLNAVADGYGGLEHRASAALICRRDDLPQPGVAEADAGYRRFLGLVSHEYFHAWHVKRIRPAEFVRADLSQEAYTRQLWIFEGITSYYDDLALLRAGLLTRQQYLEILGRSLTKLYRTNGRRHQTLEEASFDAWIKFYRPDENSPNSTVSYYLKGALVALALDLEIRLRSGGAHSLDCVMRELWREFGSDDSGGLAEGEFERLAEQVSGLDLEAFFRQNLRTTVDPPLGILLAQFGLLLHTRASDNESDAGGQTGRRKGKPRAWLGLKLRNADGRARVSHVVAGGPAQLAGLSAGDELVAINGRRAATDNFEALLDRLPPDGECSCYIFRDQTLMSITLHPMPAPRDTCYLGIDPQADADAVARRDSWLGSDA